MAVEPTVRTKLAMSRRMPSPFSATRSAVGRLALDEEVLKAVRMASQIPAKNVRGDIRANTAMHAE